MPNYDSISVAQYILALRNLSENYREILLVQFQCPRHQISAGQLARLIGYQTHSKANISYGSAAHEICDVLKIAKPGKHWFPAIAEAPQTPDGIIWVMRPKLVEAIKRLGWARGKQNQTFFSSPEEIVDVKEYEEGRVHLVAVNVFERSTKARAKCLAKFGFVCAVCDFDFEKTYGELGREFIHVHHIKPLAEIGEKYKVDPIKDLLPVCPNCHAMLHRKTPALTVSQLKELISTLCVSASLR